MEDELSLVVRRSKILTTYGLKTSSSVPSLPFITPSGSNSSPGHKNLSHFSTKGRSQLQKQARTRQIALLKINLDKNHAPKEQQNQELNHCIDNEQESFVSSIEQKLTKLMNRPSQLCQRICQQQVDVDKAEFISRCQKLAEVHDLVARQKNMRYKNKILSIILTMKSREALRELFEAVGHKAHDFGQLYSSFQKQYLSPEGVFRKNLKSLSLHCGYLIDYYRQNRYRHLNEDIQRIKCQMKEEGETVSARLKQIDSLKIRNGIFRSLQSIDLGCLANRGFYNQLTDRLRNSQL